MKIALAIVHGMGSQKPGFSHALQRGIAQHYQRLGPSYHWDDLIFKEIIWSDILSEKQEQLFQRVNYRQDLNYLAPRKYLINYLSDVLAYQSLYDNDEERPSLRRQIHQRVEQGLSQFASQSELSMASTPLVVVGHSLGSVILFNYLWEAQRKEGCCPFRRGDTLAGFISMGSPMALWTLRYPEFGQPFEFPGNGIGDALAKQARWYNFYDKDDILAYPLKQINPAFDAAVSADIAINVGGPLRHWNPLSHGAYWQDADLHRHMARFLADLYR